MLPLPRFTPFPTRRSSDLTAPIRPARNPPVGFSPEVFAACLVAGRCRGQSRRSEEHTSELQSHSDLVCRLLLEKKNQQPYPALPTTARAAGFTSPLASPSS